MIIEEIEREEAALREDLYAADRKFAEYYNVGEAKLIYLIYAIYFIKSVPRSIWDHALEWRHGFLRWFLNMQNNFILEGLRANTGSAH